MTPKIEVSRHSELCQTSCKPPESVGSNPTVPEIEVSRKWTLHQHSWKSLCIIPFHFTVSQLEYDDVTRGCQRFEFKTNCFFFIHRTITGVGPVVQIPPSHCCPNIPRPRLFTLEGTREEVKGVGYRTDNDLILQGVTVKDSHTLDPVVSDFELVQEYDSIKLCVPEQQKDILLENYRCIAMSLNFTNDVEIHDNN